MIGIKPVFGSPFGTLSKPVSGYLPVGPPSEGLLLYVKGTTDTIGLYGSVVKSSRAINVPTYSATEPAATSGGGDTYYVRVDGTVTCANRANANDPSSAETSMNLDALSNCVSGNAFSDGDNIIFSGRGGTYNITNSPDNRIYLQGGASSEIFYLADPDSQPVFDGGGTAGPLFYFSSVAQKKYYSSGLKIQNWSNSQWGVLLSNATATIDGWSCETTSGSTAFEAIDAANVTIRNITDFGGYATHWIGAHDDAQLLVENCSGYGGGAYAIHTIDDTSCIVNDCTVTAPVSGGTHAFNLQGTGTNTINRPTIIINKSGYGGFHAKNAATYTSLMTVNYPLVLFSNGANGAAFEINYDGSNGGEMVVNNATVIATDGTIGGGSRVNRYGTGTGSLTVNNSVFYGLNRRALSYTATGTITHNYCNNYGSGEAYINGGNYIENNEVAGNPLLVDYASGDGRLQSSSPLISAGSVAFADGDGDQYDADGYKTWDDGYDLPDNNAIFGWSIGAYQYAHSSPFAYHLDIVSGSGPSDWTVTLPPAPALIGALGNDNQYFNASNVPQPLTWVSFTDNSQVRFGTDGAVVYSTAQDAATIAKIDRKIGNE